VVTTKGTAVPLPAGASGPNSTRAPGFQYTGGSGGNGLHNKVTGVRIMDADSNRARAVYMNQSGQTVNPATGKTVPNADPSDIIIWIEEWPKIPSYLKLLANSYQLSLLFTTILNLFFYEKTIRVFTAPFLKNTEGEYKYPQVGSRDALCSLIGRTVVSINILGGERVELYFSGGEALSIPLSSEDQEIIEAMHYVSGQNQPIEVW
jgi:hypothetical protein